MTLADVLPRPFSALRESARSRLALAQWGLVAAPAVVLVAMAWHHRWMSDDGFIHLRVVDQVLNGNGPVFNLGERVEASTSPLWVGLLVVASVLPGLSLPMAAVLLGIGLSAVGVVMSQRAGGTLARARAGDQPGLFLPLGAAVLVALTPFWDFASSGLETGLVFAWIGTSAWWCAHRTTVVEEPARRAELLGAGLVGLGWLIRPDLAVYTVLFAGVLLAATWGTSWRRRGGIVAATVALPLVYQLFRMGYYALVVPNTALAKEAGKPQWAQGWAYLTDLVGPYRLWVPVAALVGFVAVATIDDVRAGARLRAAARLAPAVAGVLHGAYVVRAGGDFMHGRLLLPSLFGIVGPAGAWVSVERLRALRPAVTVRGMAALSASSLVVVWAVVCWAGLRRPVVPQDYLGTDPSVPRRSLIIDEREFYTNAWSLRYPIRPDLTFPSDNPWDEPEPGMATFTFPDEPPVRATLTEPFQTETAMTAAAVGVPSYSWGHAVYVMDSMSLASPIGSHFAGTVGRRPGHQKPVPAAWFVAQVSSDSALLQPVRGEIADHAAVTEARDALDCGQLGRYLDDIREPLTPTRFLGNIVDSFSNTLFRVDRDPAVAAAELCDG